MTLDPIINKSFVKVYLIRLTIKARNTNENSAEQRIWITVTYQAPTHVGAYSTTTNVTGKWDIYYKMLERRGFNE